MAPPLVDLPRLRMRHALLEAAPELAELLGGDANPSPPPSKVARGSANGDRAGSLPPRAPSSPPRKRQQPALMNPRTSFDAEKTEEEQVAEELARVKRERASLMASLAAARGVSPSENGRETTAASASPPSSSSLLSGAELQAADAARLRAEVSRKRSELDARRDERGRLELRLDKLRLDVADAEVGLREAVASAAATAPSSCPTPPPPLVLSAAAARVAELEAKLRACEATLDGDSARQRLYELLEERTRRDYDAALASVRAAQAETDGHAADAAALSAFGHQARVARGAAEAELARRKRAAEAAAATWRRRLEARRREISDLELDAAREAERKAAEAAAATERARSLRAAQLRDGRDDGEGWGASGLGSGASGNGSAASQLTVAELLPRLQAAEAALLRLRSLAGVERAQRTAGCGDVIAERWRETREKAERLRERAAEADAAEAAAVAAVEKAAAFASAAAKKENEEERGEGNDAPSAPPPPSDEELASLEAEAAAARSAASRAAAEAAAVGAAAARALSSLQWVASRAEGVLRKGGGEAKAKRGSVVDARATSRRPSSTVSASVASVPLEEELKNAAEAVAKGLEELAGVVSRSPPSSAVSAVEPATPPRRRSSLRSPSSSPRASRGAPAPAPWKSSIRLWSVDDDGVGGGSERSSFVGGVEGDGGGAAVADAGVPSREALKARAARAARADARAFAAAAAAASAAGVAAGRVGARR